MITDVGASTREQSIYAHFDRVNKSLENYSKIHRNCIIILPLTPSNNGNQPQQPLTIPLTPKGSLNREVIISLFSQDIENIYRTHLKKAEEESILLRVKDLIRSENKQSMEKRKQLLMQLIREGMKEVIGTDNNNDEDKIQDILTEESSTFEEMGFSSATSVRYNIVSFFLFS